MQGGDSRVSRRIISGALNWRYYYCIDLGVGSRCPRSGVNPVVRQFLWSSFPPRTPFPVTGKHVPDYLLIRLMFSVESLLMR
jgi:hypothetical protein